VHCERESGCAFPDERAPDVEDESSFKIQNQTPAVLEPVSLCCVKLRFQPALIRREAFPARRKASVERVPPRLLPGSIISESRRSEQAKQSSDRKCESDASNIDWMHHRKPPLATPRFGARGCKPCADNGRSGLLGVCERSRWLPRVSFRIGIQRWSDLHTAM